MEKEEVLRTVYDQDGCLIQLVNDDDVIQLFKLSFKKEFPVYSGSLDEVISESCLSDEQKQRVKNDLDLNPRFVN